MSVSISGNNCRNCCGSTSITSPCPVRVSGACVYYSGANLPGPGINVGDSLDTIVRKLVSYTDVPAVFQNTNTITFTGSGTTASPFEANVVVSTNPISTTLFSADSTGLLLNSPKLRDANQPSDTLMYSIPYGAINDAIDSMITRGGAAATATVSKQGDFDRLNITGGDINSVISLGFQQTMANCIIRVRVRVNALGSTPLVGYKGVWPGSTYSNFNNAQSSGYVNLLTGVWTVQAEGTGSVTTYNGVLGATAVNDIIEIQVERNHLIGAKYTLKNLTGYLGQVSTATISKVVNTDGTVDHLIPNIILADGDYTILNISISLIGAPRPKLLTVGDSMSVAIRIPESDQFTSKFKAKQPYNATNIGAGSTLMKGMLAAIWQVFNIRPEYLIIFNYLDPTYYGKANPASPNYATWTTDFNRYVSTIKQLGIKPIFVYPEVWSIASTANCTFYETFLNTTYPSEIKIKVLSSETFYDSTGFHYTGVTNGIIADKVIAALQTAGAL